MAIHWRLYKRAQVGITTFLIGRLSPSLFCIIVSHAARRSQPPWRLFSPAPTPLGTADAMVAAPVAPSRADLRILCGRFCAAVAVASQRRLQSRRAARHVCTHEGLLLRRGALRSRSCDDCNCGHYVITMSAAAVPPLRLFERRRTRRASPRWAATFQIGAPSHNRRCPGRPAADGGLSLISPRAHCASVQYTSTRPCFIASSRAPFCSTATWGAIAKNGPGAQSASGALSISQLLHPETDPRI